MKSFYLLLTKIFYLSAPKIVETASRFNGNLYFLIISIALTIFFATFKKRLNNPEGANGNNRYNATKKHKSDQRNRRKNQAK